jgi:hypothetical protein
MAGTIPLAMAQQIDQNGQPLAGALLYFFVAGTVATPQNAYADFGLTSPLGNPLQADQTGRIPMFWLADGLIHVRLTDSNGGPIIDTTMQVLGPSSGGGGGGGTVDPTSILSTGDLKAKYGTGPLSGFVRVNGLTMGNAVSGGTERANADTQALFIWLYNEDANLVVSGGRTGNALNDYSSGKTIALPDWRGQALGALADMGNSLTSVLTLAFFGTNPAVLGAAGGAQSTGLIAANLPGHSHNGQASGTTGVDAPDHAHSGTTGVDTPDHEHTLNGGASFTVGSSSVGSGPSSPSAAGPAALISAVSSGANARHEHPFTSGGASTRHEHAFTSNTFTTDNGNGTFNSPFASVGPMKLTTFYIKL